MNIKLKKINGLSLPEVLIALVILAISLTAIIKASISNVRDTDKLIHKTQAHWVADYILQQYQLGLLTSSSSPNTLSSFNQTWHWRAVINKSSTTIYVGLTQTKPLTQLTGYQDEQTK